MVGVRVDAVFKGDGEQQQILQTFPVLLPVELPHEQRQKEGTAEGGSHLST